MQFSLFRLLLAISVFGAAFGIFGKIAGTGTAARMVSLAVAGPLTLLVLIAKKRDYRRIRWSLGFCVIGALIGSILTVPVHPPYERGDEIRHAIIGAVIGWVIGGVIVHRKWLFQDEPTSPDPTDNVQPERRAD
jgi:hypothetical protein